MSGRLVGEVLRCAPADLTLAERMVLVCLAENARDADRLARLSAKVIADRGGLSTQTVWNALSSLTRRAIIQPQHKASRGHSQDYRITPLSEHHRASKVTKLRDRKASLRKDAIRMQFDGNASPDDEAFGSESLPPQ